MSSALGAATIRKATRSDAAACLAIVPTVEQYAARLDDSFLTTGESTTYGAAPVRLNKGKPCCEPTKAA
jgi:hypothetical protein